VAAALAVGIGAPLCALALLCLRDLIAVLPRDEAPVLPFLRVAAQLPGGELVLVPGMPMRPAELELTAFLCIAVCALALAGVGWFVARLCFKAQNKAG
ncbi:ABC transporter ATP-binding protein, partial [Escherichia coli]|nr:ABC transporter ATP-binding protein [Escherichia coli]